MSEFKNGDVVQLTCGSVHMAVENYKYGKASVMVIWMEGNIIYRRVFSKDILNKIE